MLSAQFRGIMFNTKQILEAVLAGNRQREILINQNTTIIKEMRTMSTGLTALTQAVTDLTTATNTVAADVTAPGAAITIALKDLSNNEHPAVAGAAAQIETQVAALNAASATLTTATASLPTS